MEIEWRSIAGHPGYYVSSCGKVKGPRRILKSWSTGKYAQVHLGSIRRAYVHRLVCEAFHGTAPTKWHQAAHADGDTSNNSAWNLSWKTPAENTADKYRHGTIQHGERHHSARFTAGEVEQIRRRFADGDMVSIIAADLRAPYASVWSVAKRINWKYAA